MLEKGQQINPGAIAVLATYGYTQVPVYEKPSVAIIATGSELLDVSDALEPGKIRNSNGPMITALAKKTLPGLIAILLNNTSALIAS